MKYVYAGMRKIFSDGGADHYFKLDTDAYYARMPPVVEAAEWLRQNVSDEEGSKSWRISLGDVFIRDDDHAFAFRLRFC